MDQPKRIPMETYEHRLNRLTNNSPEEIVLNILNTLHNSLISELVLANENKQYGLLMLGIHSVIDTVSKHVFLKSQKSGFKYYLECFVDAEPDTEGLRFSSIATELKHLRNTIAHQCLSRLGHSMGYDDQQDSGYRYEEDVLWINPSVYFKQFKAGFDDEGITRYSVWDYEKLLDQEELEEAKTRFLKYFKR